MELHLFNLDQPSVTNRAWYIGHFKKSTTRRKGKGRPVITKHTSKNLQQPLWVTFPWNCFQMQPGILYINSKYTSLKQKLNRSHIYGHLTLYPLHQPTPSFHRNVLDCYLKNFLVPEYLCCSWHVFIILLGPTGYCQVKMCFITEACLLTRTTVETRPWHRFPVHNHPIITLN